VDRTVVVEVFVTVDRTVLVEDLVTVFVLITVARGGVGAVVVTVLVTVAVDPTAAGAGMAVGDETVEGVSHAATDAARAAARTTIALRAKRAGMIFNVVPGDSLRSVRCGSMAETSNPMQNDALRSEISTTVHR
jgi:hypothetical protein